MGLVQVLDLDIQAQLKNDKPDAEALQKLIDQKFEVKKANTKVLVDAYLKLKSTVTQKQWEALQSLKKERMKEFLNGNKEGSHQAPANQ